MSGPVVVIDNGGGTCKVGLAGEAAPRRVVPNCSAKAKGEKQVLIADMLLDSRDIGQLSLRRPFDRGYLVNVDLEKDIWTRLLRNVLKVAPRDCAGLLLTEPMFNFPAIRAATEQVVFEELGFNALYIAPAPIFSLRRAATLMQQGGGGRLAGGGGAGAGASAAGASAAAAGCGLVVDAGFSFTHVVPMFDGQPLLAGVKRLNVGGKLQTNFMKELVSYRSFNMMDETYLIEHIKDQLCFVSQDVRADLAIAKGPGGRGAAPSPFRREFVLPDGVGNLRGYVREVAAPVMRDAAATGPPPKPAPEGQVLLLNNERFMVPEVLFHPSDIGIHQAGLAEAIVQAANSTHASLPPLLLSNIVLTGGLACCPGFRERLVAELRPLVPDTCTVNIYCPPEPALCAWEGMSQFASSRDFFAAATTRAQYEEANGRYGAGRQQARW